jgi:hypothetical protein
MQDDAGDTPLHLCSDDKVAEALLGTSRTDTAVASGQDGLLSSRTATSLTTSARQRSRQRLNVDTPNGRGERPLHLACARGDVMLVNLLLVILRILSLSFIKFIT